MREARPGPGKYVKPLSEKRKACLQLIKDAGQKGITERDLREKMYGMGFAKTKILSTLMADDMVYEESRRRYGSGARYEPWYFWCGENK